MHLVPQRAQAGVLEGDDELPIVALTKLEKALIGVEPVGAQADR
jgi:hypothetical protein